ncbi:MAG: hypothetical protein WHX52_21525 [Anaerolineae bacterium]
MIPPDEASLEVLIERCHQETTLYRHQQSSPLGYCWELFRRAIVEGSQDAWQAIDEQYREQLRRWVRAGPEAVEDVIQSALEKFIKSVTPERFVRFTGLECILAYLKRCVRAVAIDYWRQKERENVALQNLGDNWKIDSPMLNADVRLEVAECVAYIYGRLHDEQERAVVRLNLELGYKPAEIAQLCPLLFPTVADVHRIRERVLRRLADDPVIQSW